MRNRNIMFTTILLALNFSALLPRAQAASEMAPVAPDLPAMRAPMAPAPGTPDPGSVGGSFNTADGDHALFNVTTGVANTAVGWYSLFSNTDGAFNTAVGAATLAMALKGAESSMRKLVAKSALRPKELDKPFSSKATK